MKTAIVTGASSGMGAEFVKLLDREGCEELWLIARRRDRLEELARGLSTPARILCLDLLDPASFDTVSDELRSAGAEVAWLVNSAGFGEFGEVGIQPLDTQMRMIDLNVKATVRMCNIVCPYLAKGAHVVNLGSGSVFNPMPYFNIYSSTKTFVMQYSRALYYEMKGRGVSVSVFCPGWVRTDFFSHTRDDTLRSPGSYKPMTEPEDVVAYCMKKAKKNKPVIIHGWFTKTQHFLSKILPRSILTRIWLGMLTEKSGGAASPEGKNAE